jgi:hypothetical protein
MRHRPLSATEVQARMKQALLKHWADILFATRADVQFTPRSDTGEGPRAPLPRAQVLRTTWGRRLARWLRGEATS